MRHYGAEVVLIHDAGNIGDAIENCLQTAMRMQQEDPNVYVPQQFVNPANPMIHRYQTGFLHGHYRLRSKRMHNRKLCTRNTQLKLKTFSSSHPFTLF